MRIACPRTFARDAGKRKPKAAEDEPHSAAPSHFPEYSKRLLTRVLWFSARRHAWRLELSGPATSRSRRSEWSRGPSAAAVGMAVWARNHDNHSTPAIPAALDRGLNWIETAALYGLGHSGEMLARAIQGRTPIPYVFTKCERVWDENGKIGACLKAESVRRGCKDSLHRWKLTRSISTKSTGRARRRHRRRLDRVSAPEGRRQGSVDRSV